MYPRILQLPQQSFFLFGVRGVGKSSWVRRALADAERFDLLDRGQLQEFAAAPGAFGARLNALPPESWVVVDEVQRLPDLLNDVHRAIEERGLRFALLGSSARSLRRAGVNLLAGRAVQRRMLPLVPAELGADFSLETSLRLGSIALVVDSPEPEDSLRTWVDLYLREEIETEARLQNLGGFLRFLPVAAVSHAQVLNVSAIARECGVARSTVEGFLKLLEDTLVAQRVPAFEARLRRRERKLPKLYWVDPGVVRAALGRFGPLTPDERGHLFEGWLLHVLEAHNQRRELFDEVAYWSPHQSRLEVDFVLRRHGETIAIEAKSTDRFLGRMTKGLEAIAELPGLARRILVYLGSRRLRTESGIDVLPLSEFLAEIEQGDVWP